MLKPDAYELHVTPELRAKLQPKVLRALFDDVQRRKPKRTVNKGIPSLTVSEAKERLAVALPGYRQSIGEHLPLEWRDLASDPIDVGKTLHQWMAEAIMFFRQHGGHAVRLALTNSNVDQIFVQVWNALFHQCLRSLVRQSGILGQPGGTRTCDALIECMKVWTRRLCEAMAGTNSSTFSPTAFFLDVETDIDAVITFEDRSLHLRGRPDAVFFNHHKGELHLWEYKFGKQGRYELQVAQVLLYMALIESAKGILLPHGFLTVFRLEEDTEVPREVREKLGIDEPQPPFPEAVEKVFEGYVGNEAAVHSLKVKLTLALRESPPKMRSNVMLCGPGGLGKTELARRLARGLGAPLIDVPATSFKNVVDLLSQIDRTLNVQGLQPERIGTDSGRPKYKYPPLVIFIDEAHKLSKKTDEFLNFFEPRERRAVTANQVGDFTDATILLATTDQGKLPMPFRTRFKIIDLVPYSVEEVGTIVQFEFERSGKQVSRDVCEELAKVGRLIPRTALLKTGEFLEYHSYRPNSYPLTREGLHRLMKETWLTDSNGLTNSDLLYLRAVEQAPRGISALTSLLPCAREEIETVIEPYLFQIDAVKLTSRGRDITEMGRAILASATI
jgi:holliday junction DNA helicase RuvB